MLTTQKQTVTVKKLPADLSQEERMKQERIRDVRLLLENLVQREQMTVKMIVDCLYDIGSVNLINKKFPKEPLNPLMKSIAKTSKPVFKILIMRWFNRNSPEILTNWLQNKVNF
jgi:NAD(P)H-hydrate repair Nnr-like enzyme with NAD(P)H-hydrate epimerase domain